MVIVEPVLDIVASEACGAVHVSLCLDLRPRNCGGSSKYETHLHSDPLMHRTPTGL